jgi:hypothetical protein
MALYLLLFHVYEYVNVSCVHRTYGARYRFAYIKLKHYPDALRSWKVPRYTAYHHVRNRALFRCNTVKT